MDALSALIEAMVNVRGPFTLLAFLALVLLAMVSVGRLPRMISELFKSKLTNAQFYALARQAMTFSFAGFTILALSGFTLEVLTRAEVTDPDEVEEELEGDSSVSPDAKQRAVELYANGYAAYKSGDFDSAVDLFTRSAEIAPTAGTEIALSTIYAEDLGDTRRAKRHARRASELSSDVLVTTKASRIVNTTH